MTGRLDVDVSCAIGDLQLDVSFDEPVGFTALFGPSGAGKTSTLDVIAGLRRPSRGHVRFDGRTFVDTATGTWVPPERRRIGYVFQDARLFPNRTVRGNLDYGAPRDGRVRFDDVVDVLGLAALLPRAPATLSGGERQRVALGRALLADPLLLLMDEPLGAVDVARRIATLAWLEAVRDAFALPIVYVSHDLSSVLRFTDRAIGIDRGRIVGTGTPESVVGACGAAAVGGVDNTIRAEVRARDTEAGTVTAVAGTLSLTVLDRGEREGESVVAVVPAHEVMLSADPPGRVSTRNVQRGRVARIAAIGPRRLVTLDFGGTELAVEVVAPTLTDLGIAPGVELFALIKATAVRLIRTG